MTFSQLIDILKARFKLVLLIAFIITVSAIVIVLLLPKKYKATNTVIFNYKVSDPISGTVLPAQLLPGYMATEVDIITSKTVAAKAVEALGLNKNQEMIDEFNADTDTDGDGLGEGDFNEWMAETLVKSIDVSPSRRSNLIAISAIDESPQHAAAIANAVSDAYLKKSIQMNVAPSRTAANFYKTQLADLQEKIEVANQKYTDFQRDNEIQGIGDRDVDVETARLNELSNQLVLVQSQVAESRSRNQAAKRGGSPDVVADEVVQVHKATLAKAEAEFAAISSKYASNHPDYIAAKSQVDEARSALNRQIGAVSRSVSSSASIYAQSEAEIKAALEKQKTLVLNLNKARNELSLLERDLINAQKSYDAANERFIKSNLEGESNQSNVTLLSKAVAPRLPYSPKRKLIVVLAAFIGVFSGMAFVLISELFDRKIRSLEDMESLFDFPAFGVLPKTELKELTHEHVKTLSFKR
jgi:polysaccharide biosynthesis transport protein